MQSTNQKGTAGQDRRDILAAAMRRAAADTSTKPPRQAPKRPPTTKPGATSPE